MTADERIADLERRVSELERLTLPMLPLGPRPDDPMERQQTIDHIMDSLRERITEIVIHSEQPTPTQAQSQPGHPDKLKSPLG